MLKWRVMLYPLDGQPPRALEHTRAGKSREYCEFTATNWRKSFVNDGTFEAVVEPMDGWEDAGGDPLAAVVIGVSKGAVSVPVAISQIRRIFADDQIPIG